MGSRTGVRKYGFHGLSYEYVVDHVGADVLGRAVVAHLGNGASLAAIRGGSSIDTTMGFTPTGGIPMSTRTGDLDPGVLVYLVRDRKLDAAGVEELIDRHGGLLGYSGTSGDMKELLEARDSDPHAGLAVDAFCYRIRLQVGAYAAALGGLDTLVFTGGIGEHAAAVRTEVCAGLEHLGVALDDARNTDGEEIISAVGSACTVRVVQTNEDLMVARHTHVLLGAP
jgi:acetate kinase